MTFFTKVASFALAVKATEEVESIIKVAAENEISRNDLIVYHNLTEGNVFTGENLVKIAEDEPQSALLVAVETYEKLAAENINEDQAMALITNAGLAAEDFNAVADLIVKQASEAGVVASEEVWEKVAEVHEFLSEAGLDPVTSMDFAESFSAADSEYAQDKVASEFDDLDEESIDKIAEAFEFLEDIEGVGVADLMAEYEKEAGIKEQALKGFNKAKDAAAKFGDDVTGKSLKDAKAANKGFFGKKKKLKNVEDAEGATRNARIGAGATAGLVGGAALAKEASEVTVTADEAVWEKVAEAHEFLAEAGLDPVISMEFAETFLAAEDEAAQDKVASEFDGLGEASIDKVAEAFEFLKDIEGVSLTDLMSEVDKEAGAKEVVGKAAGKVSAAAKRLGDDLSGKGVKDAQDSAKGFFKSKKKGVAGVAGAKKRRNIARAGAGAAAAGVVAGGVAASGSGDSTTFKGRG